MIETQDERSLWQLNHHLLTQCLECAVQYDRQMGRCPICGQVYSSARDDLLEKNRDALSRRLMDAETDDSLLAWLTTDVNLTDSEAIELLASAKSNIQPTQQDRAIRRGIRRCLVISSALVAGLCLAFYALHKYVNPDLGERPLFHVLWESDFIPAPREWKLVRPKEDDHGNVLLLDGTRNILVVVLFRNSPAAASGLASAQGHIKVERADHNSADIIISTQPQMRIVVNCKLDTLFLVRGETGEIAEFPLPERQESAAGLFYHLNEGGTVDQLCNAIDSDERAKLRDLVQKWIDEE